MTIALQGSDALVAKASVAGTVTVAVWGRIVGTVYQNLVPAAGSAVTLTGTPTTYYSPGGSAQAIVSFVQMCNPSGASITVTQYSQTGASQTQVGQWVIPTLGRLEYTLEGWKLYDGVGNAQTVGTPGATGPQGLAAQAIALEPDQGEEGMAIPGPVGTTGAQGIQGIQGLQGIAASAIAIEPDQGEEGLAIPGPAGATGPQGVQGTPGVAVQFDADQGDDGMPIPAGVILPGTITPTMFAPAPPQTVFGNNTGGSATPAFQTSFSISGSGTASAFQATAGLFSNVSVGGAVLLNSPSGTYNGLEIAPQLTSSNVGVILTPVTTATNGTSLDVNLFGAAATAAGNGGAVQFEGGAGNGAGTGGVALAVAGPGGATGNGGGALLQGGSGGATSGSGGAANVTGGAGVGTNSSGGNVVLTGGAKTGSGTAGVIQLASQTAVTPLSVAGFVTNTSGGVLGTVPTIPNASITTPPVTSVTGTAPIVSSGGLTPAISITPATTVAAGSMAATDKAFLTAFNGSVDIVVTSNAYSNLKCDGATDDTAALNALFAAAPDGSNLVWPAQNSTMVLTAAAVIPSGKHFNFIGWEDGKSNWLQTSPTADHITCGDWYSTFNSINFVTNNTTTTASQTLTSGTVLTVTAVNTALVAASGTINVGSTAGWQSLTYSARTATTVTLSATGTGSSVIGAPLVFKTAGAALNAGNFVGIDAINCSATCCFNGYIASGSTANSSIIDNWGGLNNINFNIQIDAANWNGIIINCSCDCTVNSRTLSHLEILQCGSITGQNNQFIRGMFNMRLGSTTAAYPAGVFGVYFAESFFDNAGTDAVRVQGISAVQRIKLTACWLSSAQAGNGLNFASTATTLPTDIELLVCNIYSNSANGITGAGVQDYKVIGGEIAGNVTAGVAVTAAAGSVTSVTLANVRIGPTGGIGANGTGVTIATGTYASVVVRGCDLTGNTTALTLGTVTVATWSRFALTDNPGWNPHGAVTTPTFPTTTTVVTNTTGHRVSAWTKMGATAPTAMSVNGVATAVPLLNTLIPIVLDPGGTVVFTYATAPTWVWIGN